MISCDRGAIDAWDAMARYGTLWDNPARYGTMVRVLPLARYGTLWDAMGQRVIFHA